MVRCESVFPELEHFSSYPSFLGSVSPLLPLCPTSNPCQTLSFLYVLCLNVWTRHHAKCILKPGSITDITLLKGFDGLRWDDQVKVKKLLGFADDTAGGGGASKSPSTKSSVPSDAIEDYAKIGYSGGNKKCDSCGEVFKARTLRVVVTEDGETFHADSECWSIPAQVATSSLVGFEKLKADDREEVEAVVLEANPSLSSSGKASASSESPEAKAAREASERLWKAKDEIREKYNSFELKAILQHNDQEWHGLGPTELVDRVADGMVNGGLPKCGECGGHMRPASGGKVKCHGHLSAWSRCTFETNASDIKRNKWKTPAASTLVKLVESVKDEQQGKKNAFLDGPQDSNTPAPDAFKGLVFVLLGGWDEQEDDTTKITQGGGSVSNTFTAKVTHVLAPFEEVDDSSSSNKRPPVKKTKSLASKLPILDPRIIRFCTSQKRTLKNLDNLDDFLVFVDGKARKPDDNKVTHTEKKKKRKRLIVPPIDKDCELREEYQIYVANNCVYAISLNMTDLTVGDRGKNSLYVMQALQHKTKKNRFAFFTKWGRIGMDLNMKIDDYNSPGPMVKVFEEKFYKMTQNHFESYMNNEFEKKPGGYYPVDLDSEEAESDEEEAKAEGEKTSQALKERKKRVEAMLAGAAPKKVEKLDPRVAELITLIFNKEMINKQMQDMKIDTKKMPLGQLSKRTLRDGIELLEKIEALIKEDGYSKAKLQDLCNRFYTTIPHDFGMGRPPTIDDMETLQAKYDLLDTLMDIEVAARMLEMESEEQEDPLMMKYKELGNTIVALDRDTDEFKRLETYVKNTQGHQKLKILDIYKLARNGEDKIFAQHDSLDYRKLLFHGSNVAVFPAILSGGIKIMPHSGGRVGRGNYSADMIDKSQGYCGLAGRIGLILLNEVALGNVSKIYADNSKLVAAPKGYQSVLACGQMQPDPSMDFTDTTLSPSGHPVIIPQGSKSNQPGAANSSFLHNEYLVYDATQVRMRYLLRLQWV